MVGYELPVWGATQEVPMANATFDPSSVIARERLDAIDAGYALPTQWYRDPAIFALELERIHRRAWHFATHVGDLREQRRRLSAQRRRRADRAGARRRRRRARLPQRVPAPQPSCRDRSRQPQGAAVPLPRLEVSARRQPAECTAQRRRCALRSGGTRSGAGRHARVGTDDLDQPRPQRASRSTNGSAACRN